MKYKKECMIFLYMQVCVVCILADSRFNARAKEGYGVGGPRVEKDADGNTVTTWDCVWFGSYWQNDTNGDGVADRKDDKEPVKWRVLEVNGDDAFLVADMGLDTIRYDDNSDVINTWWNICTIRCWLNGYGNEENRCEKDYSDDNFLDNAFSKEEQAYINETYAANSYNDEEYFATKDKVFLLSLDEVRNPLYGFLSSYEISDTRKTANSCYAEERESLAEYSGACAWWLRSPGGIWGNAYCVDEYGGIDEQGKSVYDFKAVRPAIHMDLKSTEWKEADKAVAVVNIPETPTATPAATPTNAPTAKPTDRPVLVMEAPPTESPYPEPSATTAPSAGPAAEEPDRTEADKFIENRFKAPDGSIITEITDSTRDIVISSEEYWKKLSGMSQKMVDKMLKREGSRYVYRQLLKMAKAYKIPGFRVIKYMQSKTSARLRLIKGRGANVIHISSRPGTATVGRNGVIRARKPGRATVTYAAVRGKYTNRLVIRLRVRKKFNNAKEISGVKSGNIKHPTVLIAKKRELGKYGRIRIHNLEKDSTVKFKPLKKGILSIDRNGRYIGKRTGSTLIRAKVNQNNKQYILYVYVTIYQL